MTVLLLGSTGRVGPHVARSLLDRGASVRVLTRDAERAATVLPEGVEIVSGSSQEVSAHLDDVTAVLLLSEHGPDMQEAQEGVIAALADSSARIVKISGSTAIIRPDGPDAGRQHWAVEQALAGGSNPWIVLRPNAFMQTLVAGTAATVQAGGFVANPIGTAGIALIDAVDIGEAAAVALLSQGEHDGSTLVLTGPTSYGYADVASAIGVATGRDIVVKDVPPESIGDALRAKGASDWEASHLVGMLALFGQGVSEEVTGDVEALIGRAPRTIQDYLADNSALFATDG
ncbi:NAD(P)H-binding protein [Ornithinimicrobium faecis]|uniref:NmrA family NAD(P)-binding protein n=1 Tax=Ornithinimicrobium faecis TaxID=2934158 RepID=UPI0021197BFC|nr:NAD(P)H-binding protein [Ornithinimicrobium sp. HY1745]